MPIVVKNKQYLTSHYVAAMMIGSRQYAIYIAIMVIELFKSKVFMLEMICKMSAVLIKLNMAVDYKQINIHNRNYNNVDNSDN